MLGQTTGPSSRQTEIRTPARRLMALFLSILAPLSQGPEKQFISFLRHLTLIYPLVSIAITSGRVLQGLGKGIPVLVITTVRVLGLSAPLAIYFSVYLF